MNCSYKEKKLTVIRDVHNKLSYMLFLYLFKAFSHLKNTTIYQNIKPLSFPNSSPEKCGLT